MKKYLNTWTILLISICFSLPASGSGILDESRSFFFGDLRNNYDEAYKYLEKSDEMMGSVALRKFNDNLEKLKDKMNPLLGTYYSYLSGPAQQEVRNFMNGPFQRLIVSTNDLGYRLGNSNYSSNLDQWKQAFSKCGEEFNKLFEYFEVYGKKLNAQSQKVVDAGNDIKAAKSVLYSDADNYWNNVVRYLENKNTDDAKKSIEDFKYAWGKLSGYSGYFISISQKSDEFSSDVKSQWGSFYSSSGVVNDFGNYFLDLTRNFESGSYDNALSRCKDDFKKIKDDFNSFSEKFFEHNRQVYEKWEKMHDICSSCN